jgi:hypothetical protein
MLSNHINGVIVRVLAWNVVDHGFETLSGQIKDYKFGICCYSTRQAAMWSKSSESGYFVCV